MRSAATTNNQSRSKKPALVSCSTSSGTLGSSLVGEFGLSDFGLGDFGLGDFGLGDFGLGDFGPGFFGLGRAVVNVNHGYFSACCCP
jgi:hypothetical protein